MHNHHAPRLGTAVQGHPEPSPRLSRPHHARVHILLLGLDHPAPASALALLGWSVRRAGGGGEIFAQRATVSGSREYLLTYLGF